ncbi:hypothetical protein AB8O55_11855 [Saccharopolyspora cebuensis]|uniref:Uncharacterized protein n=1 Tax=Saccharopolyspora cebuensis TaxID=418759 RepID=A0ABV4CJS1_9PSEU
MPAGLVVILGEHSSASEDDGYLFGWFSGDLADDMPTQLLPAVQESPPRHGWAEATPVLLTSLIKGLWEL